MDRHGTGDVPADSGGLDARHQLLSITGTLSIVLYQPFAAVKGGRKLVSRARNDYLATAMSKHLASVLTTVNAPYSVQLDDAALAHCLADLDLAKQHPGHVSTFLGEVSPALQVEFAAVHYIPVVDLKAFAAAFSAWSGESYPLAA